VAGLNDRFTRAAFRHARSFFAYYRCDIIDPYFAIRINLLFVSPSPRARPRGCRLLASLKLPQIESDRIDHPPVSTDNLSILSKAATVFLYGKEGERATRM